MAALLIGLAGVFLLLLLGELLRNKNLVRGEVARKFVHMTVGTYVAFWPYFMSWNYIRIACVAFVIIVFLDRRLHVFKSIHSVQRKTTGDIFFPLGIMLTTFVTQTPLIFTTAVLNLSLGDGFAAILGQYFVRNRYYRVFKQRKSIVGSLAFWFVSVAIICVVVQVAPEMFGDTRVAAVILIPFIATFLEGVSIFGLDNVMVPVVVALLLSGLQQR